MEQVKRYFRLPAGVAVLIWMAVASDGVRANMRVPGTLVVSTRTSTAMAVNEQPTLYCGRTGGQVVGCWNKERYDEWVRKQGQSERSQSFAPSYDGQRIVVDQSQFDFQPTVNLQTGEGGNSANGPAPSPKKKINLEYQITLKDPGSKNPLTIDNRMVMGYSFADDTLKQISAAAPEVMNLLDRQKQLEQTRELFQRQLEIAQRQSEAMVTGLRQESQAIAAQAHEVNGLGMVSLGAGLLGSNALFSPQQIQALEKVRKLHESDLRFSRYQMNSEAYEILDKVLAQKIKDGRWAELPGVVEAMNYAEVTGPQMDSKSLKSIVSNDGVIKAGSFFDQKKFKTEFKSENGQIARRIVNRYQAVWKESDSLKYLSSQERAQFFMGSLAVSLGDEVIAAGDLVRGSGLLKMAQSVVDGLQGFTTGLSESAVELVKSIPEIAKLAGQGLVSLATDPEGSWEATVNFVSNLGEVKGAIINALNHDYEKLKTGSAFEKGHVIGKYTLDVLSLVAAGGSANAVKAVGNSGRLASAIEKVNAVEKLTSLVPTTVVTKMGAPVLTAAKTIETMPAAMRAGLKFSSVRQPEIAAAIAHTYEKAVTSGNKVAATYLQRVAASKQAIPTAGEVGKIMETHAALTEKMKLVPKSSKDSVFSRAITKEYKDIVTGKIVHTSEKEVFNKTAVQLTNEHRFTIGGELGHSGMYMTEGTVADTRRVLAMETGKEITELWFAEKKIPLNNMLDLTQPKNLETLGIDPKILLRDDYNIPHVIGDTAKSNGFQGIIFNSAKDGSKVNVVIFN